MNNSGICIRELIEYFKIDAENVIVFQDDLDIDFEKIKTKFGGSSAGHNGIESIENLLEDHQRRNWYWPSKSKLKHLTMYYKTSMMMKKRNFLLPKI